MRGVHSFLFAQFRAIAINRNERGSKPFGMASKSSSAALRDGGHDAAPGQRHGGGSYPRWSHIGHDRVFETADAQIITASYSVKNDSFISEKPSGSTKNVRKVYR